MIGLFNKNLEKLDFYVFDDESRSLLLVYQKEIAKLYLPKFFATKVVRNFFVLKSLFYCQNKRLPVLQISAENGRRDN